jgi:hypothetical protein
MECDFNNLRKKLIKDYNNVIDSLNEAICTDVDMDRVVIPVQDLSLILERLRSDVIIIGAINDPAIKDCGCVLGEDIEVKEFLPNI